MPLSRREFTALALATGVVGLAPVRTSGAAAARRRADFFQWRPVRDSLRAAVGEGGNSLVVPGKGTSAGSLLVDTKFAGLSPVLREEAERGGRLAYVVNTHHHGDHTGGNIAFVGDVPVVAHERCLQRVLDQTDSYRGQLEGGPAQLGRNADAVSKEAMEKAGRWAETASDLAPDRWAPTETMQDSRRIELGGTVVELRHAGAGHTDNDVFVWLPDVNVLHTGDLVFHRLYPYLDPPAGMTTSGWMDSCRAMLELCDADTVVVPGHGELTDASGIREQIRFFESAREQVRRAIDAGKGKEEVQQMSLEGFEGYGREQLRPRALGAMFDELAEL